MNRTTPTPKLKSSHLPEDAFSSALKEVTRVRDRRAFVRTLGIGAVSFAAPRGFAAEDDPTQPAKSETAEIDSICERIFDYLLECQDFTPGEYYGSFWSEKGYHGPLLDYDAGGSHHHRTAGSGGLALWLLGLKRDDAELKHRARLRLARSTTATQWRFSRDPEQ